MGTATIAPHTFTVFNQSRGLTVASSVALASTSRQRKRGLLGIDELPLDAGLWISPCEAIHTFGMNMPIDAIFIDRSRRVLKLYPSIPPRRIGWCLRGQSVIELATGAIARSQTAIGDRLQLIRNQALDETY